MGIVKVNTKYRAAGDKQRIDGIDLISSDEPKYGEPSLMNRFANPLQVPSSGANYSYEKWVSFECTSDFSPSINEIKVWSDNVQPASNVTWYGRIQSAYEEPELVTSVVSISGIGTISISGSATILGTGTSFLSDFASGQLMRIPGVSHLFQPKTIGSDTSITLWNTYSGIVSDSSFMIEPFARMDTYMDGSDDWHCLSISGIWAESGDEYGYLVMAEEAGAGATLGECPATEDSALIYYNWESSDGINSVYCIADSFTPAFDYRPSISGMNELVVGENDSTIMGVGTLIYGEDYYNFNAYQGTIYGWTKPDWSGDDDKEHYLLDVQNGDDRLSLRKTTTDNQMQFRITDGTTTSVASVSSVTITQGTRYWFFGRWDTSNTIDGTNYLKLTVNNTSSGSTTVPPVIDVPTSIGWLQDDDGNNKWTGTVQLGIEERAWTDNEVAEVYDVGRGKEWDADPELKGFLIGEIYSGDDQKVIQFPQGEASGYKNMVSGGHQDGSPVWTCSANVSDAESTTRKFGLKSRQITWAAGAATNAKAYMTIGTLDNAQDYLYDFYVYVMSLTDNLYLRISPNSGFTSYCVNKRLDTGKDDDGTTYATGTWLHYKGTFRSGGSQTHYFGLAKVGTNGGAVILADQIRIHKSIYESPHCWLWESITDNWEDISLNWEVLI